MVQFIYTITVFYVTILVLLVALGASIGADEQLIEFPVFPELPGAQDVIDRLGLLGVIAGFFILILEFIGFVFLIIGFLFEIVQFTLVDFLPVWLNTLIFLPLIILIVYEVIARQVRGS